MIRRLLVLTAAPVLLVAACALPTDERATRYDRDDLPPVIANTTTTSTTTTTTSTTLPTAPSTTSVPTGSSEPAPAPTTTSTPAFASNAVDLYYTIDFSYDMARVKRPLPDDVTITQVIDQLERPRTDVAGFGYRTSVRREMVTGVVVEGGVATVALDGDIVKDMSEPSLRRAIAQLVLTLTSFSTDDSGAIGQVRFEIDGEGLEVFVPALDGSSEPGAELTFDDFESLRVTTDTPTTTTTPTPSAPPPVTDPVTTAA